MLKDDIEKKKKKLGHTHNNEWPNMFGPLNELRHVTLRKALGHVFFLFSKDLSTPYVFF
jgi:hypothetical protein